MGRVVIPKEIRRTMRIREGDPLEIFTNAGEVIFKKYSPIGEISQFAAQYAETLNKTCSLAVVICDRDTVIASAGLPKREYTDRKLSKDLEEIIEGRTLFNAVNEEIPVVEGGQHYVSCAMPIISGGDITGCVASVKTGDSPSLQPGLEAKLIQTAAGFFGRQLEE